MTQIFNIQHPLPLETAVKANKPNCPCKGGGVTAITGRIKKIINNQTGNWYYLDSGSTVSEKWIIEIIK